MIIAVVLIYLISVIGKFISLLTIVNGIQKYANLDNYHYVITTYEYNKRIEKVESWFKDGVLKSIFEYYNVNLDVEEVQLCIDYNNNYGYIMDKNGKKDINMEEYFTANPNFYEGKQLMSEIPLNLRKNNIVYLLNESLNVIIMVSDEENLTLKFSDSLIEIKKDNMLPQLFYSYNKNDNISTIKFFEIDLGGVKNITI